MLILPTTTNSSSILSSPEPVVALVTKIEPIKMRNAVGRVEYRFTYLCVLEKPDRSQFHAATPDRKGRTTKIGAPQDGMINTAGYYISFRLFFRQFPANCRSIAV